MEIVSREERAAYHQAGHIVACVLLDVPFKAATLERMERGEYQAEWQSGKLDLREAVAAMAGPTAETLRIGGKVDEAVRQGVLQDAAEIVECCHAVLPPDNTGVMESNFIGAAGTGAGDLLNRVGNWVLVKAVAGALRERKCLTWAESALIVDGTTAAVRRRERNAAKRRRKGEK